MMKNAKINVDLRSTQVGAIKKYILLRSMKKIDDILRKTQHIKYPP